MYELNHPLKIFFFLYRKLWFRNPPYHCLKLPQGDFHPFAWTANSILASCSQSTLYLTFIGWCSGTTMESTLNWHKGEELPQQSFFIVWAGTVWIWLAFALFSLVQSSVRIHLQLPTNSVQPPFPMWLLHSGGVEAVRQCGRVSLRGQLVPTVEMATRAPVRWRVLSSSMIIIALFLNFCFTAILPGSS